MAGRRSSVVARAGRRPPGPLGAPGSGGEQPLEEAAVPLEGDAQVLGGDVLAAAPLLLEALALGGEALGDALHDLGDELVGLLDGAARLVDEPRLDRLPAALELRVLVARQQLDLGGLLLDGLLLRVGLVGLDAAGDLAGAQALLGLHRHLTSSIRSDRVDSSSLSVSSSSSANSAR